MTELEQPPLHNQSSTSNNTVRWESTLQSQQQQQQQNNNIDEDYDGGNSTARLFERTRIQVLAGMRACVKKRE